MKKLKYLLLLSFTFLLLTPRIYAATTIRETTEDNDGYSTLEEGSIIIGVTRFSPDNIVTASKAATAGVNDVMLYLSQNGSTKGYEMPGVYYYIDPYVGWFFLDNENAATPVENQKELEKLSKLDIYYTNNVEKVLEVDFPSGNVDISTLPDGVIFKNNKLYINATVPKVEFKTKDDKNVSLEMDSTTSQFIENVKTCYTVNKGVITTYNSECGSEVVIPLEINEEKIIGIGQDAFRNTNLTSVVIPSEITSLGSNAFADNKLESVVIKEKYNESDFSFYGDNIFGTFDKVLYDNELTRMLNYVDSDYKLKYYNTVNVERLVNNPSREYGLIDYLTSDLTKKVEMKSNNKNFTYCWGACNFEERYVNKKEISQKDLYGVSIVNLENYTYDIAIEKYDVSENKVYQASKIMNVTFEETGIKEDYNTVIEAIDNLQTDERYENEFKEKNGNTRKKYLQDLEDLYDIDVVLTRLGYGLGLEDQDKIIRDADGTNSYYLKNGVLYQNISDIMLIGRKNNYIPTLMPDDYDNLDIYAEEVIKEFVKDTGVTNYHIYLNDNGKSYGLGNKSYKTGTYYEIELIDIDYSEKWVIEFIDYYPNQYDENGFTKASCFGFDNGTITSYDGTCGGDVKIPNQINNIDVVKIDGYFVDLFRDSGIRSLTLPNKLQHIGFAAFANNRITELILPETITSLESAAFDDNQIKNIVLPNSLTYMGHSVFSNNQIETVKIGSNLETIGLGAFMSNKIKKIDVPKNIKLIDESAFKDNLIEELILNEGLETIEMNSFENNKIQKLTLPKTLKTIKEMSFNDNLLEDNEAFIYDIKYNEETKIYEYDYETIVSYGGKNRENVIIPSNVKNIKMFAFRDLNLEKVELPYGLETIGEMAFYSNKLTYISIPDTIKSLGEDAFSINKFTGENSFIYLFDKNGKIDKTNLVAYENKYNYEIDKITIPNTIKKIWPNAFSRGTIKELIIPYGVEEIGDGAFSSTNIKNPVTLPKSITKLGINIFNSGDGENNFVYARNEDGTVDKSILMAYKKYSIDYETVTIPKGVVEIRENVFREKTGLTNIILPSTLEIIGNNAFYNINASEITIPSKVKSIGDNAFENEYRTLNILVENKEKAEDFEYLGINPFGTNNKVVYQNNIEVTGITFNKNQTEILVGETEGLEYQITPSNAINQNITWKSSNPAVATVENGVVTALSEGITIITATINGYSTTCKVTVTETYTYLWEQIDVSIADEYYLYIVNSKGEKVSGKINVIYQNDKNKEFDVTEEGIKLVKNAVTSVEIINANKDTEEV